MAVISQFTYALNIEIIESLYIALSGARKIEKFVKWRELGENFWQVSLFLTILKYPPLISFSPMKRMPVYYIIIMLCC